MPYTPQTWHDSPATDTPISAARLGVIETGVQTAQSTAEAAAAKSANLSDLASASTARTNLGLGSIATHNTTEYAATPAHVFTPESYGAKGNGVVATVNTTNGNTTVVATTAVFTDTATDGGKYILVHGALGSGSGPLITTIASVTDTTHAVLQAAPTATVSACPAVFGTDDTAAINTCVSAASTYAQANNYAAEVVFGAKVYVLASGPTQVGNGSTTPTFNTQIPMPYPAADGTSRKLLFTLRGAGDNGVYQYWQSKIPNVAGTALVSMVTAPSSPDGTFGVQSVIGGPTGGAGFTSSLGQAFANTKVTIDGIAIWVPLFTNVWGCDLGFVSACRITRCSAHAFAPPGYGGGVQPYVKDQVATLGGKSNTAWRTPINQNNADITMDDVTAEGFGVGFNVSDHFAAGRISALCVGVGISIAPGGGQQSYVTIQHFDIEAYVGGILANSGGTCTVNITMNAEVGSPTYDLNDPSSSLHGVIRWRDVVDTRLVPVVSGGGKVKIVNDELFAGAWSGQPAVPSSTVAQQNTSWRDAAVSIKGGTVTVVAVDGVTCATATGTTVIVPSGKNITLTYSAAPTWAWTLL